MKKHQSRNYLFILGLLLFIFLMPIIIAAILFNKNPNWLHHKTVNKGTLIPANLNLQQLKLIPNKPPLHSLKANWLLLYLTLTPCDELCQKNLYKMRQIILALGKYRHQVQYGLILANDTPLQMQFASSKAGDLLVYTLSKEHFQKISSTLNIKNFKAAAYFLSDPTGKIILYYPNNAVGEDIYQDLMRLLTISTTG
ncbi:MAG: hypothetical protein RLY40_1317 [Pseudomonadota bacterium]|jgi:cytochrome oxidase Cu insertion factor (SCO1/SenC/PrrC family)